MPQQSQIRSLFNNIAPHYDGLNHIMSLGIDSCWRRRAVKKIADKNRVQRILDIATGTGDFAIAIAKKAHQDSKIIGIDIAENMLEIGRRKVPSQVELHLGSAEKTDFENDCFDVVSIAFGVRNFENLNIALAEIYRILKNKGKLVILELSYPNSKILLALYKLYALHFLPFIGGLISGDKSAYTYLPQSILKFPKEETFIQLLQNAGFQNTEYKKFTLGACLMYVAEKL